MTTAATPGTLSASDASMPLIVAWAYGRRTMSSQSWPGRLTSSMYSPSPRMKRGSSLRLTEWPMPPTSGVVWSGASVVIVVSPAQPAAAGSAETAWPSVVAAATTGADSAALSSPAACWIALTMFT